MVQPQPVVKVAKEDPKEVVPEVVAVPDLPEDTMMMIMSQELPRVAKDQLEVVQEVKDLLVVIDQQVTDPTEVAKEVADQTEDTLETTRTCKTEDPEETTLSMVVNAEVP